MNASPATAMSLSLPTTPANGVTRLPVLPSQIQHAKMVANARTSANDATRKPSQDMGKAKNRRADCAGALAEIVVYAALESIGLRPAYTLVAVRPVKEPDFTLNGTTYEVKTCLPEGNYVCINYAAHNNPKKRPQFYLFVIFDAAFKTACLMRPVKASDADKWQLRTDSRSPYLSISKNVLQPLANLSDIAKL